MSGADSRALGRWGEALAAEEYRRRGLRVTAAGFTSRYGEIDLIAEDDKYIAFIEVKLRKSDRFAPARAFVDQKKQEKLLLTAQYYLMKHPSELQPRFDVVEIYAPDGRETKHPVINVIENAFTA